MMSDELTVSFAFFAVLIFALDRISKILILIGGRARTCSLRSFGPRVHRIENARIGLGLIRNKRLLILIWGSAFTSIILLLSWFHPLRTTTASMALGVAFGGATGNLFDIIVRGSILDFIDLRVWPVFNLADVAIVAGVSATFLSVSVPV